MKFHPPVLRSVRKDPILETFFRPQRDTSHVSGTSLSRGREGNDPRTASAPPSALGPSSMVQCKVLPGKRPSADIHASAREGIGAGGSSFPHLDAIQDSFGPEHDLSNVKAHLGGSAASANDKMGSEAYATGNHVAFRSRPSRWLAAHEAAHVVQQRQGLRLSGGVGQTGDWGERNADAVADRVAAGRSARDLLAPQGAQGLVGGTQQGAPGPVSGSQASQGTSPVQQKIEGMDKEAIQKQGWWDKFSKTTPPSKVEAMLKLAENDTEYTLGDALQGAGIKMMIVNAGVKKQWQELNYNLDANALNINVNNNNKNIDIPKNNNKIIDNSPPVINLGNEKPMNNRKDSLEDVMALFDDLTKEEEASFVNENVNPKNDVIINNNKIKPKKNDEIEQKVNIKNKQGNDPLGYKYYKQGKFDPRSNMVGNMAKGQEFGEAQLKKQQAMLGGGGQMRNKTKNKVDDIGVLTELANYDKSEVLQIEDEKVRENYRVTITEEGKFIWAKSEEPVTAKSGIFVMMNGNIYLHDEEQNLKIKHTTLSGGQGVFMAGTMKINNGVLEEVSSASGHYKPSVHQLQRYVQKLGALGVPLDNLAVWIVTGKI